MAEIKLELDEKKHGGFYLYDQDEQIGEMIIGIAGDKLTVYHTEINPEVSGQGLAKQLLEAMVAYARENQLRVIPLCLYVLAQFKRHPENYTDIWEGSMTGKD